MTWKDVIDGVQTSLSLVEKVDPAIGATAEEIIALTGIAGNVINVVSSQTGAPIEDVIAGLTFENPTV